ncbi:MAG TPA: RNA polymerase sigma factor SigJ [Candidatus Dormibacteraeota bacterium]|nr:RNA polymerase sigma factor SigJ [Candidatus Dormibacteraeota bacterium]
MDEPTRAPRDQAPSEPDERRSLRAERRSRLAEAFERQRPYLRRVAYRMLGSMAEAEDALQECWIRLDRRPPEDMADLRPWLTTVIGRICLDALRARRSHREDNVGSWLPEPVVAMYDSPEDEAARADSVGLALLVVLETLSPPERLAFVLHDVFAVPFDEIAPIVDRSTEATRQLASRGRRRVRAARADRDEDVVVRRNVADAFLAAARGGEFEQLLALLDPDVALHIDVGDREALAQPPIRGARQVAEYLRSGAGIFAPLCRPAIVNGGPGFVVGRPGQVIGVVGLTLAAGRIREVDIVADAAKLEAIRRAGW